jgi:hypothetical protein
MLGDVAGQVVTGCHGDLRRLRDAGVTVAGCRRADLG